ncbi:MAG: hypothetical protein RBS40_08110 [Rhodocyclaceae bacterium]|jgi:hypothetical protein|nr:hypothetical protein [Rhodocyclaceae bacterium]
MKATVTIEIDTAGPCSLEDRYLAQLWHVAQANPAPSTDQEAADLAEDIGREIIRRWLVAAPPELYAHQGHMPYWHLLMQHGKFSDHGRAWTPNPREARPSFARTIETSSGEAA